MSINRKRADSKILHTFPWNKYFYTLKGRYTDLSQRKSIPFRKKPSQAINFNLKRINN